MAHKTVIPLQKNFDKTRSDDVFALFIADSCMVKRAPRQQSTGKYWGLEALGGTRLPAASQISIGFAISWCLVQDLSLYAISTSFRNCLNYMYMYNCRNSYM